MSPLDLGAALEPLYRAYLARLDVMAARLPAEVLLRESTTRNPDGSLTLGKDGLPLVFDVANRDTGETFEVRGKSPDLPLLAAARVGALQIDLLPGNWEALPVICKFEAAPRAQEQLELAELIRSFALVAAQGGYARCGGGEPPAPWSGRLHSLRVAADELTMTAVLDLGTCPPAAVAVLVSALEGLGRDLTTIERVTLGGPADET